MQFDIAPYALPAGQLPRSTPSLASDLLRQILDVQRQQLDLMKANQQSLTAMAEAQNQARKRSWFDRWQEEFPDLPENCRRVMPMLERAYLNLIATMVEEVRDNEGESFESDFALRDFVDRFGLPLVHLGGILSALAPLTEVQPQNPDQAAS
jgi:hypothetical protein